MSGLRDRYYKKEREQEPFREREERYQEEREYVDDDNYIDEEDYENAQQPMMPRQGGQQGVDYQLPQQVQNSYEEGERIEEGPLAILEDIKNQPSPKGTYPVMIGGRPLDLHALEEYVVKISPQSLTTLLRYRNARTIEEIKGYGKGFSGVKMKGSTIILLLAAVGMGILGIILMLFLPEIMAMFQGGI